MHTVLLLMRWCNFLLRNLDYLFKLWLGRLKIIREKGQLITPLAVEKMILLDFLTL